MMNTISVLIPTKNRRVLLERALNSVFLQSILPEQIIVINDGSTDDTDSFVKKLMITHPEITYIKNDSSRGVNKVRNLGFSLAKTKWVSFLDDDDEFLQDAIMLMKKNIDSITEDIPIVFFNTIIVTDTNIFEGGFNFKSNTEYYDPSYEDVMTKKGLKGDCKPVIRTDLINKEKYLFSEDVNGFESHFFALVRRDGIKIRYYKDKSSKIYFTGNDHLSFSASIKNPKSFILIHEKQLLDHCDFYNKNKNILFKKYIEILKLSVRSYSFLKMFHYVYLLFLLRYTMITKD